MTAGKRLGFIAVAVFCTALTIIPAPKGGVRMAEHSDMSADMSGPALPNAPDETDAPDGTNEQDSDLRTDTREPLLSNETVVFGFAELKDALSKDNAITTVYFGADIVMEAGIKINPKKQDVTVCGINPLSDDKQRHTLTDRVSLSFYDTVYIDEAGTKSLHVCDLVINGKNFYGPFSVFAASALSDVAVTYENIEYTGPQLGYHRYGTIRFVDCTAKIVHGGQGASPNQEFYEVKHAVFEGTSTIETSSGSNTVFWNPLGGTFTLADGAVLSLLSTDTSALYGVFYADGAAYSTSVTVGRGAVLSMTLTDSATPSSAVSLDAFTVKEGGVFELTTTEQESGNALRIAGPLTVEHSAQFNIYGYGNSLYSALRVESGDIYVGRGAVFKINSRTAYRSLVELSGRSLVCDNPSVVLLYGFSRCILSSGAPGVVTFGAGQINYWSTQISTALDYPAQSRWEKSGKSEFTITGTLASGGDFTSLSSNYEVGDLPGYSPDFTNFSMSNARVLALGQHELHLTAPVSGSKHVTGTTSPGARVRVTLVRNGEILTAADTFADDFGAFEVTLSGVLMSEDTVKVQSEWQYLTAETESAVLDTGTLELTVPEIMEFYETELSAGLLTILRLDPHWSIFVTDTRAEKGSWQIYARLGGELTTDDMGARELTGAVIFVESGKVVQTLSTDGDVCIYTQPSDGETDLTEIGWGVHSGVLLRVLPGAARADTVYTAEIIWTLTDSP